MPQKKLLLSVLATFFLGIIFIPIPIVEVNAAGLKESDCYALLREKAASVAGGSGFLAAAPADYVSMESSLSTQETGIANMMKLYFANPIFREEFYNFGDKANAKFLDVFPYFQILNLGNNGIKNEYLHKYGVFFVYDKGDDQFTGCRAVIREVKNGKNITELTNSDIGMVNAFRVASGVEDLQSGGANYKRIVVEEDAMNKDYSAPTYTDHVIEVFLETNRIDFNPYKLVDYYADLTNRYYSELIPLIKKEFVDTNSPKEPFGQNTGDLVMEIFTSVRDDGGFKGVYGIQPITFNGKIINDYTYVPWARYNMVAEMLRLGQTDVSDVWFSNVPNQHLQDIIQVVKGEKELDAAGLSEGVRESNTLKENSDYLLRTAVGIGSTQNVSNPNTTDEVKLFWRIKQLVDKGVSDAELKKYVADYPAYLKAVAEAQKKLAEIANSKGSDIEKEAWYADFVYELMNWGVVNGYADGTYRPADLVNRAEIAKIAVILFSLPLPDSVTSNPFPDVPKDTWFAPYVAAAKEAGVIDGYPDGSFKPAGFVNRAEAMKMFTAASGVSVTSITTPVFPDVSAREWYSSYVNFAGSKGVVSGYADGKFKPGSNINRAEIAKMAANAKKLLIK